MSEFQVRVVEINKVGKHPNADNLSITQVLGDYPVIFRSGDYQPGDKAVYISVDAVVPADDPRWEFLGDDRRIKAKKLRGIFSLGILTKAEPGWEVGQDVRNELRIEKYTPPEPLSMGGDNEHCPFYFPTYTDVEGLRRWSDILKDGEEVIISEKVHGANGRWVYRDDRLWVGSHHNIKRENKDNLWWKAAYLYNLDVKLRRFTNLALYGEVYGDVQDLKYGLKKGQVALALFDAMDLTSCRYLDATEFYDLITALELPTSPILYHGTWNKEKISLAEGNSKIQGSDCIREGFVVRPVKERFDEEVGRVILKYPGEGYLLRKSR